MKRILVTGSRDWTDEQKLAGYLSLSLTQDLDENVIVHGACPSGADKMASDWCKATGLREEPHPADWAAHGKAAGFRRNAEMAALGADLCLAFWDGESRGTAHMIACAVKAGISVRILPKSTKGGDG
jgi:hypothetical protein